MRKLQPLISLICLLFLTMACNDEKTTEGLQNVDTRCYTTEGGNTSEELIATSAWNIQVDAGDNPWLTVKPASGSGQKDPYNLIFVALVNNNAQSRFATVVLTIGNKEYIYSVFQDGTEENTCTN